MTTAGLNLSKARDAKTNFQILILVSFCLIVPVLQPHLTCMTLELDWMKSDLVGALSMKDWPLVQIPVEVLIIAFHSYI